MCPQDRLRQAQGERKRELVLRCVGVARSSGFLPSQGQALPSQERRVGGRGARRRAGPGDIGGVPTLAGRAIRESPLRRMR